MKDAETKLVIDTKASVLPPKDELLADVGHVFIGKTLWGHYDCLFMITQQEKYDGHQIVMLHPKEGSGGVRSYDDLSQSAYRPLDTITYTVKEAR